jgi:elongation factor G
MEDPSLGVETSKESGQTLLRGLGELHLEIVVDRIRRQFNLQVTTGKAYVAYRETLDPDAYSEGTHERGAGRYVVCSM